MLESNIWGIADILLNESHQRNEDIFSQLQFFEINRDNINTLSVDSLLSTSLWPTTSFCDFAIENLSH